MQLEEVEEVDSDSAVAGCCKAPLIYWNHKLGVYFRTQYMYLYTTSRQCSLAHWYENHAQSSALNMIINRLMQFSIPT